MEVSTSNPPKEQNSLKNNLIQNFYIIGFSPDDFFRVDKKEKKGVFMNIFEENPEKELNIKPKIITKFPNAKISINSIPDQIVTDHCFPNDKIEITNHKEKEFFQFSLDNIPQNYENDFKSLYSRIYFSCLIIKEPLINYFKFKKEIINSALQNQSFTLSDSDINLPLEPDDEIKYSELYIPKIICFACVLPFYYELKLLLECIHDYYLSQNNFSSLPLEKVIEKIISKIPIPINQGEDLIINFDTDNFKKKIIFPQNILSEINIQYYADISLVPLFQYFSVDDILRIFKYILYEIPILFFSDDKSICSLFVDIFLTLLTPFKYVFPHISILPKKLYGLIGTEKNYIFGINELYQESFFETNNIELTKNVIIISVEFNKNPSVKIEEKIYVNNNEKKIYIITDNISKTKENTIIINGVVTPILNVDIPNIFKKKLSDGINKYLSFMKKKFGFFKKETVPTDFNFKIQKVFYKFFVGILEGYTDCLLKSQYLYNDIFTKNANIGENLFIKYNEKFRFEVFNEDEYMTRIQKEYWPFYRIFFNTKMFTYFLRERIYNTDEISQLSFKRFDLLTFLKKNKEMRKRPENRVLYQNFKFYNSEVINIQKKYEIIIKEEDTFNKIDIEKYINNKEANMNLLLDSGQLFQAKENVKDINNKNDNISKYIDIKYLIFPKLNFIYLSKNNYNQLNLMSDSYLINYKNICQNKRVEYEKIRPYAFYSFFFPNINKTNISYVNYEIHSKNYIYYIWLMLLSSSLYYCEKEERNYRLDKMFILLNDYQYIEEYVLNFIFINLYKSANTFYLVKFIILYYKIVGHVNYYLLNLFCDKIQNNSESEKIESENNNINTGTKRDLVFSKRYLVNPDYNFDDELKNDSNGNEVIDELIFCSEQDCQQCHQIINIDAKQLSENHTSLQIENYKYHCLRCNLMNDVYIKYQILKFNYITKEIILIEKGKFKLLTPFKLYQDLKSYFIKENSVQLNINSILTKGNKFNFMNIIFNFSLLNMSYDFLFPYEKRLRTSIKSLFGSCNLNNNKKDLNTNKIKEKEADKPVKLNFENKQKNNFRQFYNIKPLLNPEKVKSKILGFINKEKYVYNELSFTIKNQKNNNKKKK